MPSFSARFAPRTTVSLLLVAVSWFNLSASAGEAAPADDNTPELFFDSALPLDVITAAGPFYFDHHGRTPTSFAPGVRIPKNSGWGVLVAENEKLDDAHKKKFAAQLADEIRKHSLAMVSIRLPGLPAPLLEALADCATVKWLYLDPALENVDFALIARLPELAALVARVPDADSVKALAKLPKLRRLAMRSSTDEVVQSLEQLPALEELDLGGTEAVTLKSLETLAALRNLKALDLTGTAITPRQFLAWPGLQRFARLEKLYIGQPTARVDCLAELQVALPDTTINGNPARGQGKAEALSEEFRTKLDGTVAALGNEDFDVREAALRQLLKHGPRIEDYLNEKLKALKPTDDPEIRNSLQRTAARLKHFDRESEVERALAELDKAVEEAPKHYQPPDPSVQEKLKTKISFEFVETPLEEALNCVARFCNVAIAVDPKALEAAPQITLRVIDMNTDLAMEWILRLAELESTIRGKAVVVANQAKISQLKLQTLTLKLPLEPGEKPWTQEESELAAEVLCEQPGAWAGYVSGQFKAQPGQINVIVESSNGISRFVSDYNRAARAGTRLVPAFYADLERKLDAKVDLKLAGKTGFDLTKLVNKDDTLLVLGQGHDDKLDEQKLPDDFVGADIAIRDVLLKAADGLRLKLFPRAGAIVLTKEDPELRAFFVDVREALKSGVPVEEVRLALQAIARDHGGACAQRHVRGRWLLYADAWSGERALTLLADVAKTGKIPAKLPPLTWFTLALER